MSHHAKAVLKIRRMHAKARAYMESDPEVSLMLARKTAEAVCKLVFSDKVSPNVGNLMLDKMIEQLTAGSHVPKHVLTHLRTIQVHGNFGAHDQEDDYAVDAEYVLPCINSLDYTCRWLIEKYIPPLILNAPILVQELAQALGVKTFQVIKDLMLMNLFVNQSTLLDQKTASEVVKKYGWRFTILKS